MLGYPAGFGRDHVRLADGIQQSRLAVIDVTHDRHDRRSRLGLYFSLGTLQITLDLGALRGDGRVA